MNPQLSSEEFVGYTFKDGAPPKRSRLWFIDRELRQLCPEHTAGLNGGLVISLSTSVGAWTCRAPESRQLHDMYINWESDNELIIWKLTNTIIPHIHTFGRDDDTWRLGLWPD